MCIPIQELWSQPCGLGESRSAQHLAVGERQLSLPFTSLALVTAYLQLGYLWSHGSTLSVALPFASQAGSPGFIDALVSKKLGRCPVSPKMGPFCVSLLLYRNKGNYGLPP